jgi:hypothetical protein
MLEMTKTLYNTMQNQYTQPQQAPAPVAPAPVQPSSGPPDPNLIYTDAPEYQRRLGVWQQEQTMQTMQVQAQPMMSGQAEMAKNESKRNAAYTEVWDRYGPEIEAEAAALPLQVKVSPKFWNDAAALVKGRHAEELFKDRMAKAGGGDTGTFASGGMAGGDGTYQSNASPLAKAWQDDEPWIQKFKRLPDFGLRDLQDRCAQLGWSETDYVKHYANKSAMRIHRSDDELSRHGVM